MVEEKKRSNGKKNPNSVKAVDKRRINAIAIKMLFYATSFKTIIIIVLPTQVSFDNFGYLIYMCMYVYSNKKKKKQFSLQKKKFNLIPNNRKKLRKNYRKM